MAVFTAIGTAVATALFGAAASASLAYVMVAGATAFALQTAAGLALSYFGQMLSGKGEDRTATSGVRLSMVAGGDVPRSYIEGLGATAGSLVYANEWGNSGETPNAYSVQVIALSDLPSKGLDGVWVNDAPGTFGGSPHGSFGYPVTEFRDENGADHLWIKFYDGTQTVADSYLTGSVSSSERPYSSARVGYGITYAIVTSLLHETLLDSIPQVKFVVDGTALYDPTKDTTVGGSGSQRWDDPTTWGGDGDYLPAVQIYNKLRGIFYDGDWFYGLQVTTAEQVPAADWIAEIDKCRAVIAGPDGNEATYRCGGEVLVSAQISDSISDDLTACNGRLAEMGGVYKLHFGEPDTEVASFTDGTIISTEGQTFTPFFPLMETITGVTATFPDPESGWVPKVAPILRDTTLEAKAGGRRQFANVSLVKVPYPAQVQRLMKWALAEAQRERRHVLTMPPEFFVLEPGDIIEWNSTRNGYVDKLFRVDGVVLQPNLDVMIEITETDPADYDWAQEYDYVAPVASPVIRVLPAPQLMTGWQALPATIFDASASARRPSIEVQFDGSLVDVRAVRIQVRESWDYNQIIFDGEIPYPDDVSPSVILNGVFLGDTMYEVRGIYVPFSSRTTRWSNQDIDGVDGAWLSVTTPDIPELAPDSVEIANLVQEVRNRLDEVMTGLPARIAELEAEQEQLASGALTNQVGNKRDVSVLKAQLAGNVAAVIREETARVTEDAALAELIELVAVNFGGTVAAALFRAVAAATDEEGWASIEMQARASIGSDWPSITGLVLQAKTSGEARAVLYGKQVVIADENGTILALFSADGASIENARIINLNADNIQVKSLDADEVLVDGSTITDLIAANATSKTEVFADNSAISVASGLGEIEVASKSITPQGGTGSRVTVNFVCSLYATSNGANNWGSFRGQLYRAGVAVTGAYCVARPDDENQDGLIVINYVDESPGTTSITWSVGVIYITSPGPGNNISARGRYLELTNLKK